MKIKRDGNSIQTSEINEIRRLIVNKNIKDLLEIGTYRGNLVLSLYDLVVEEHDGSITSVDMKQPNDYDKENKKYIDEHNMKEVHLSVIGANKFFARNNKSFDMVILDGNLSYDQVKSDLENSIGVITEDGIIVICRYRNSSSVQAVVNEIDERLYDKMLIHTVHHLMTVSKKKSVRTPPKFEVSKVANENDMRSDEIKEPIIQEENEIDG
jgi:predicted O-methyltransferase YrrM